MKLFLFAAILLAGLVGCVNVDAKYDSDAWRKEASQWRKVGQSYADGDRNSTPCDNDEDPEVDD